MVTPEPRRARLVLVLADGTALGLTPEVAVATPWWPHAGAVVEAARDQLGLEVVVLRLLEAERTRPPGGLVTYLAEIAEPPSASAPLEPWPHELEDHPLRMPWARPGGPAADLAWATEALRAAGLTAAGPAQQIGSWNLSSVWRLPLGDGAAAWLKHVPTFFAHEGAVIEANAGGPVPRLIARDGPRALMAEIPGVDLHGADVPTLHRLVATLVPLQAGWVGRTQRLLELGLPDWRGPALTTAIRALIDRWRGALVDEDIAALDAFATDLPDRYAAIDAAGIPDTLVYGDFHPGNARGEGATVTLLDWGDSGVGHPLLDQSAFLDRVPADAVPSLETAWTAAWQTAVPGSDPAQAALLLRPIAAARQALIYQGFLDRIEPSEHPYHRDDPVEWLQRAAALIRAE